MAFRVSTTEEAERDLEAILAWLRTQGAADAGDRWLDDLEVRIASLERMPRRCPLAPESETHRRDIRQLLYGTKPHIYRILFTVNDDLVTVLHIRHGRRLPFPPQ